MIGVVGLGIAFFLGNRQIKISEKQVLLSDFQFKMNNLIQMRNETEMRIDAELQSIKSYELQWYDINSQNVQQCIARINSFSESNKQNINIYNEIFRVYSESLNIK